MSSVAKNKSVIDKKMSFEDAMAELENVVRQLEGGRVKLEDAVDLYERGAALKKHCDDKLKEAKLKVEKISVNANGELYSARADESIC
ncbi:MAG: exodeoxyribonuclease VII small subunit [Alphaproteobacteria bacterium]|nr:exodeoxyribonuclease VII small subunit [Alphaproteobacteria bacterium]